MRQFIFYLENQPKFSLFKHAKYVRHDDSLLLIDTNPHHELVFLVAAKIAWQTEKLKIKPFSPTGWNPDSKPGLH
jgi:hypothetical protein